MINKFSPLVEKYCNFFIIINYDDLIFKLINDK